MIFCFFQQDALYSKDVYREEKGEVSVREKSLPKEIIHLCWHSPLRDPGTGNHSIVQVVARSVFVVGTAFSSRITVKTESGHLLHFTYNYAILEQCIIVPTTCNTGVLVYRSGGFNDVENVEFRFTIISIHRMKRILSSISSDSVFFY